jgi:hypothetical protein
MPAETAGREARRKGPRTPRWAFSHGIRQVRENADAARDPDPDGNPRKADRLRSSRTRLKIVVSPVRVWVSTWATPIASEGVWSLPRRNGDRVRDLVLGHRIGAMYTLASLVEGSIGLADPMCELGGAQTRDKWFTRSRSCSWCRPRVRPASRERQRRTQPRRQGLQGVGGALGTTCG